MPVEEDKLDNLLTKFWEISKIPEENEIDDEITVKFQETIWFNEATGRYNVQPPWKSSMQDLPTNFIEISKNDWTVYKTVSTRRTQNLSSITTNYLNNLILDS